MSVCLYVWLSVLYSTTNVFNQWAAYSIVARIFQFWLRLIDGAILRKILTHFLYVDLDWISSSVKFSDTPSLRRTKYMNIILWSLIFWHNICNIKSFFGYFVYVLEYVRKQPYTAGVSNLFNQTKLSCDFNFSDVCPFQVWTKSRKVMSLFTNTLNKVKKKLQLIAMKIEQWICLYICIINFIGI